MTEIQLTSPVRFGNEEIGVLKLREPRARDFRAIGNLDKPFAAMLDLAASLADLPASALDDLSASDTMKVVEAVSGFLPQSLPTGQR